MVTSGMADYSHRVDSSDLFARVVEDTQDAPRAIHGFTPRVFFSGLIILWLAIGSPMDGFADALLSAHMVEHLL